MYFGRRQTTSSHDNNIYVNDLQAMDLTPRTIIIEPKAAHTHTVVFLHGRGDTAPHFYQSITHDTDIRGRTYEAAFPSFRWVYPQAAMGNRARFPRDKTSQWFDVWNAKDFSEREELQVQGLRDSVDLIRGVLEAEAAALGGRWNRVILAGISQGAATGVHALINLSLPLGALGLCGFLGFSCRMPFAGRTLEATRQVLGLQSTPGNAQVLEHTPVLLEHCVNDPLVGVQHGRALRETLRSFGATVNWKEYPDGRHWFNSPNGTEDAMMFIEQLISRESRMDVSG
jgi:predicted esterase